MKLTQRACVRQIPGRPESEIKIVFNRRNNFPRMIVFNSSIQTFSQPKSEWCMPF